MGWRVEAPGVSTFRPLLWNWQRVNLIVKLLLGFTRSYPSTVQGARGLVGQLALVLDSN